MLHGYKQLYSLHRKEDIYVDIGKTNWNKKVIGLIKDELDGKVTTEFAALRPKACSYLTDDSDENVSSKNISKQ